MYGFIAPVRFRRRMLYAQRHSTMAFFHGTQKELRAVLCRPAASLEPMIFSDLFCQIDLFYFLSACKDICAADHCEKCKDQKACLIACNRRSAVAACCFCSISCSTSATCSSIRGCSLVVELRICSCCKLSAASNRTSA